MTNVPNPGIVEHSEESNYIQVQQLYLELSICFNLFYNISLPHPILLTNLILFYPLIFPFNF